MAINARRMATELLIRVHSEGSYSNVVLDTLLKQIQRGHEPLASSDKALISRIFYGVLERQLTLDYILSCYSRIKLKRMHPVVLNLLRVGCYQLLYMDRIPASAAVNETVKLARCMKQVRSAGFINAVLRAIDRNREHLLDDMPKDERGLAIRTSCPVELISMWSGAYGKEAAAAIATSANEVPPITIRINTLQTSTEVFEKVLTQAEISFNRHSYLPACLIIKDASGLKKLAKTLETCYYHQDAASQFCCFALDAQPGDRVADVCAAPGGKSITCAQMMQNQGEILACDIYPKKCDTMQKRAQQFGITIMSTAVQDASASCPDSLIHSFDRVICDVPCSGLGVIRRKPEIRYKSLDSFSDLPKLQAAILHQSAQLVRQGGILQYSTCTLNPAENEKIAAQFLKQHPDFAPRCLPLDNCFAALGQNPSHQITLFPSIHKTDGFYIASFEKTR